MTARHTDIAEKLRHQRDLNHSIPDVIIELAKELKNVCYRDAIISFASAYYDAEFSTLEDEFFVVRDFECKLIGECLGVNVAKTIDRIMKGELAAVAIDENYRDHFVHAFQDFLTGLLVIDQFYNEFTQWYSSSNSTKTNPKTCFETSWLLATLFHDQFKMNRVLSEYLQQETRLPPQLRDKARNIALASNLTSFYDHIQSGKTLESWTAPNSVINHPLVDLLLYQLKKKNHGVVGGLTLLTHNLVDETNIPAVYSAALTIALHDRQPRKELLERGIFPVNMEKFPLIVLMLYCDALQEWNRSTASKAELVDFQFSEKEVIFVLKFSSERARKKKEEEFQDLGQCVGSVPIKLWFANAAYLGEQTVEVNDES
ncbi:MAG: hypothetical protein ABSA92_11550 [Candidatus Bathyarchaeia archaeon]|jgi:hypothetical protein